MTLTVQQFLKLTFKPDGFNVRPRVKCADGFSISIQGGTYGHYGTPKGTFPGRVCKNVNVYETLELGFPTYAGVIMRSMLWLAKRFPKLVNCNNTLIGKYAESPEDPENTVYSYVPLDTVEKLISIHGGIVAVQSDNNPEEYIGIHKYTWKY